jgi:crossover junction endodeoxyribonuclease RuvC
MTGAPGGPLVAGIDLSLTSTGVVLSIGHMHRVRSKGKRDDTLTVRNTRLNVIADTVVALAATADLAVVEQPAYGQPGGSVHDRAGLWWLVVSRLHDLGVPVAEASPTARAKYATGKGGGPSASKDAVLAAVVRRFPDWDVTGNDVADALVLCAMGRDHLGAPLADIPALHRDALLKVAWPAAPTRLNGTRP